MRTRERKDFQSIRTAWDIFRDDRARIATCSWRTATERPKENYSVYRLLLAIKSVYLIKWDNWLVWSTNKRFYWGLITMWYIAFNKYISGDITTTLTNAYPAILQLHLTNTYSATLQLNLTNTYPATVQLHLKRHRHDLRVPVSSLSRFMLSLPQCSAPGVLNCMLGRLGGLPSLYWRHLSISYEKYNYWQNRHINTSLNIRQKVSGKFILPRKLTKLTPSWVKVNLAEQIIVFTLLMSPQLIIFLLGCINIVD